MGLPSLWQGNHIPSEDHPTFFSWLSNPLVLSLTLFFWNFLKFFKKRKVFTMIWILFRIFYFKHEYFNIWIQFDSSLDTKKLKKVKLIWLYFLTLHSLTLTQIMGKQLLCLILLFSKYKYDIGFNSCSRSRPS